MQNSHTAQDIVAMAKALGAEAVGGITKAEQTLLLGTTTACDTAVHETREAILSGRDPLGEQLSQLRTASERREMGAIFTPSMIVDPMIQWAASHADTCQVVDAGTGSGRFLVAAGRKIPDVQLVGIELDPLSALVARAHLSAAGLAGRSVVKVADYRSVDLPHAASRRMFIGNPPYVRHHQIDPQWKTWLRSKANELGLQASKLAGLHVYFFLATALHARKGDYGAFITSAEWLDVNYGKLVRDLFLGCLGGQAITVLEPTATPFPDAMVTGAVTCFEVGTRPASVHINRVQSPKKLHDIGTGQAVHRNRLEVEQRWSHITRRGTAPPQGYVELGELCRVHRGQVTGANKIWIESDKCHGLPENVLFPTVTRAKELYEADQCLSNPTQLRRVIDLPIDLDVFDRTERLAIEKFLKRARKLGVHLGYVARNRKAWWAVGLREAAPILATYMARRPPAFVRNEAQARHINIAHGLYPREPLSDSILEGLVQYLSENVSTTEGRTYAGGLTKFEPREMERLHVPQPQVIASGVA